MISLDIEITCLYRKYQYHIITHAPSINTFKNKLDKHWKDWDILYDYKATLETSVTRKGSEISIGTNPELNILTLEIQNFQVTPSNKNIQDAYKIQEEAESRQMCPTEEEVRRAATCCIHMQR